MGADVRALVGARPAGQARQQIVAGFVSYQKPLPAAFTDTLWVVIPSHSSEISTPFAKWPQCHGSALPAAGDAVVVAYDEQHVPHVIAVDA